MQCTKWHYSLFILNTRAVSHLVDGWLIIIFFYKWAMLSCRNLTMVQWQQIKMMIAKFQVIAQDVKNHLNLTSEEMCTRAT